MNRIFFDRDDARFRPEMSLLGAGCHERMPPGFVSRMQGLQEWLLVLFHDTVLVEIEGRRDWVQPGTMLLWDRHRPHYFGRPEQEWDHSWVVFGGSLWMEEQEWMRPLYEIPTRFERVEVLENGFARLLREFGEMERPSLPILADNIRLLMREMGREQRPDAFPSIHLLRRVCGWIAQNLDRRLSVSDVARQAACSPTRLQQLFRENHGCSVQVWIERQRMQEVRYLLMHSGLRLKEIAGRTGFSDAFYLSRRFSRTFGLSPAAYRKLHYGRPDDDPAFPEKRALS